MQEGPGIRGLSGRGKHPKEAARVGQSHRKPTRAKAKGGGGTSDQAKGRYDSAAGQQEPLPETLLPSKTWRIKQGGFHCGAGLVVSYKSQEEHWFPTVPKHPDPGMQTDAPSGLHLSKCTPMGSLASR